MIRIFHDTNYHFLKHWRISAILTAAFIVAGLATYAITGAPSFNPSIIWCRYPERPAQKKIRRRKGIRIGVYCIIDKLCITG